MRIADVRLTSADVDGAARFYETVLGLPVVSAPGTARVGIGASTLSLVSGPTGPGVHHLAFEVPQNRFADAKRWLAGRVELIALDGTDEFTGSGSWNSHSVYFDGPEGVVLELIARHELANDSDGPFSSADLLDVSEIGIAVPDVPSAVAQLCRTFGVAPFGSGSDSFAPIGDHEGLLIVVARGRVWFPTDGVPCQGGPTTVTLAGVATGTWSPPEIDCVVACG
jgi:catechol 2,3-dioxygenase-like lactoylglutathione lyase family enzyme